MSRSAAIALLSMLASCGHPADPKAQAKRAADLYLDSISMRDPQRPAEVNDAGPHWVVIYRPPPGWAGGSRWVWVDKRTMKIAGSIASQ